MTAIAEHYLKIDQQLNFDPAEFASAMGRTAEFVAEAALQLELGVGLDLALQNRQGCVSFSASQRSQQLGLDVGGQPGSGGSFVIKHDTATGRTNCADFWAAQPGLGAVGSKLLLVGSEAKRMFWYKVSDGKPQLEGSAPATPSTILEMAKGMAQHASALAELPIDDRPVGFSAESGLWVPQDVSVGMLAATAQIAASTIGDEQLDGSIRTQLRLVSRGRRLYWHAKGKGVSATELHASDSKGKATASFKLRAMPDIAVDGNERSFITAELSVRSQGGEENATVQDVLAYEDERLVRTRSIRAATGEIIDQESYPATPHTVIGMAQRAIGMALGVEQEVA